MIGRQRDFGPDAPEVGPARFIIAAIIVAALLLGGLILIASSMAS